MVRAHLKCTFDRPRMALQGEFSGHRVVLQPIQLQSPAAGQNAERTWQANRTIDTDFRTARDVLERVPESHIRASVTSTEASKQPGYRQVKSRLSDE